MQGDRLEDDWVPLEDPRGEEERAEESRKLEAHSRAVVLEMIGDLPEADAKPPSDMLFVCKLNPVTTEEVRSPSSPPMLLHAVRNAAACATEADGSLDSQRGICGWYIMGSFCPEIACAKSWLSLLLYGERPCAKCALSRQHHNIVCLPWHALCSGQVACFKCLPTQFATKSCHN